MHEIKKHRDKKVRAGRDTKMHKVITKNTKTKSEVREKAVKRKEGGEERPEGLKLACEI